MSDLREIKVVVLGSGGVGKSALTIRLVNQNFLEDYEATIEDNYNKTVNVDGIPVHLDILDTAGQDEYSQLQDQWMREGRGIVLVYSIDNMASFQALNKFKEKLDRVKKKEIYSLILIGNKCDLEDRREVSKALGQELATSWNCHFMETSARNKINHEECFFQLVRTIRDAEAKLNKKNAPKKSWCILL